MDFTGEVPSIREHKEQSTVEVNFTMTFNAKEMDGLRSIVQSEVTARRMPEHRSRIFAGVHHEAPK